MNKQEVGCARMSLDVGEPLFGSATPGIERWLLIEHDGAWAPDALDSEGLPPALVSAVRGWLTRGPGRRAQLIRRARAYAEDAEREGRRLYLIDAREGREVIAEGVVDDDLWAEAPADLFEDDAELPRLQERKTPLVLVCTHGKRDLCCSRLGIPIYRALAEEFRDTSDEVVWQTSHVGGHRFAANIVLLPHGYHYGRLDAPVARRVVRGYLRGRLTDLDRLRGRSAYAPEVQAAEFWYRQASGQCAVDAIRLVRVEVAEDRGVGVTLADGGSDEVHELWVAREATGDLSSPSCGAEAVPVVRYGLDSLRRLAGAESAGGGRE